MNTATQAEGRDSARVVAGMHEAIDQNYMDEEEARTKAGPCPVVPLYAHPQAAAQGVTDEMAQRLADAFYDRFHAGRLPLECARTLLTAALQESAK